MIKKLRIVCPVCVLCLVVLLCCIVGVKTKAGAAEQVLDDAAVTYTADAWSASGMAVPAMAQETSAVLPADAPRMETVDFGTVPAQAHRDSGCELSDADRMTVERIVMCEAGGESEKGQMMVAQCILDGMLRYGYSVDEYIDKYQVMLTSYSNVTDQVRNSVSRVFDDGERVVEEKADLWYNPAITASLWHEQQHYVTTVGSHRFFWMQDGSET